MQGKLAGLEAQCSLLDEKIRKFNAKKDEMNSIMSALKKANEDIKMDLISWAMFALMFSAMYMI